MKKRKLKISFGKKNFSLNLILTCNKYISRWFVFKGHGLQMKNYVCQSNISKSAPIKSLLPECRSVFSIPVYLLWVARLVFLQELLNPVQRVAVIPGRASRRSRGLGGTSCRSYSSLCLWVLAVGTTADTCVVPVLDTTCLGAGCFPFCTIPELPLGLRVGSAVTCSAFYNHNTEM